MEEVHDGHDQPVSSTCRCVICLKVFELSGMSVGRVERKNCLLTFVQKFSEISVGHNKGPEELVFLTGLQDTVMKTDDMSLCGDCHSDVSLIISTANEKKNMEFLNHHLRTNLFQTSQMMRNQNFMMCDGLANLSKKIESSNTNIAEVAPLTQSGFSNMIADASWKKLEQFRIKFRKVIGHLAVKNPNQMVVPQQDTVANTSDGIKIGYGPFYMGQSSDMMTVGHSYAALDFSQGNRVQGLSELPSSSSSAIQSIPMVRYDGAAGGEGSRHLMLKRPFLGNESGMQVDVEKETGPIADQDAQVVKKKKSNGSQQETGGDFKRKIIQEVLRKANENKSGTSAGVTDSVSNYRLPNDNMVVIGSIPVRINEDRESLECKGFACRFATYKPKENLATSNAAGKKQYRRDPHKVIVEKMMAHIGNIHNEKVEFGNAKRKRGNAQLVESADDGILPTPVSSITEHGLLSENEVQLWMRGSQDLTGESNTGIEKTVQEDVKMLSQQ